MNKYQREIWRGLGLPAMMLLSAMALATLTACSAEAPADDVASGEPVAEEEIAPTAVVEQEVTAEVEATATDEIVEQEDVAELFLMSEVFSDGDPIPKEFTCDGEDISPPLKWEGAPLSTASYVLVMDDPDAPGGTWIHWILVNIPAEVNELPPAIPPLVDLADGSSHGQNSWGRSDYGGPCPPSGTHRYFFKLFALDQLMDFAPGITVDQVLQGIQDHIVAETTLMGTYTR
jgi:Raf kinase inhibitor-like YbhB/YbcL family protein